MLLGVQLAASSHNGRGAVGTVCVSTQLQQQQQQEAASEGQTCGGARGALVLRLRGALPAVAGVYERAEPGHVVRPVVDGPQVHAQARAGVARQVSASRGCMRAMQSLWGQA